MEENSVIASLSRGATVSLASCYKARFIRMPIGTLFLVIRRRITWMALPFIILCGPLGAQGLLSSYQLGPGDKIKVQVFGEDDLSVETRVGDNGTISYPFLGEIRVRGLTGQGLENLIVKRLKGPYLVDPMVTVSILEYRPFYVNGEVAKPGGFPFSPGLTVRKAIALAGGFQERANENRINVVREDDARGEGRPIGLDDQVMPGDTITVERSFF
jgi:polysaccharide biosynthesis/export protein VpsN